MARRLLQFTPKTPNVVRCGASSSGSKTRALAARCKAMAASGVLCCRTLCKWLMEAQLALNGAALGWNSPWSLGDKDGVVSRGGVGLLGD